MHFLVARDSFHYGNDAVARFAASFIFLRTTQQLDLSSHRNHLPVEPRIRQRRYFVLPRVVME